MVELSLGTPGCYPLPLPFSFLLARYWDMHSAWLAPCWNHTCCTVQEDLSRVEQLSPTLAVHLLQQSFLLCWAMDVPAVCVGSWMGALGALPGRRGGEAAMQTEGLCSEGCWALGKLRSHKAACVQDVPTAWWDGSLLAQTASRWAQAGPVVSSPAFLSLAPNTDQTLGRW